MTLVDLLVELLTWGAEGVETAAGAAPKGPAIVLCVIGLGLAATIAGVLAVSADPLNEPAWAFWMFLCAFLHGLVAIPQSVFLLFKHQSARVVATFGLVTSCLAVALAIVPFT